MAKFSLVRINYNEFGKIPRKMNLQCRIDTFVFVACIDLPKNAKEKKNFFLM